MPSTATDMLDGLSTSVAVKAPCIAVLTTNNALSGLQGYTADDRILCTGQTDPIDNGIYNASSGQWQRALDADGARDFVQGTRVLVRASSIDGVEYELTTANPIIIGTSSLSFVLRYGANATYDQTSGEAGLTIVNESYEPGIIDRYGTNSIPGTTSMAVAVQAAFDSGALVRGIPGATYFCGTTTIDVPAGARASLYGVRLKSTVSSDVFLDIVGDDVEILGAEIEGNGNGAATAASEALARFSGSSAASYRAGLTLRDCYIHESGFYGVRCDFARDINVENCKITECAYAGFEGRSVTNAKVNHNSISDITPGSSGNAYGIVFTRTSGDTISVYPRSKNCQAIGNTITGISIWEALDTHGGDGIVFADNVVEDCLYGINIGPDTTDLVAPLNCVASGNIIRSGALTANPGRAIGSGGADASNKASNIAITGNTIDGYGANSNSDGAIMFQYTDGLVATGNVVEDSRGSAFCLLLDNDEFVVVGNSIRGIRNGVANAAGINIRNTTQTGHIADNYINATAEIGIYIANANTGVSFGRNRIVTSGSTYTDALYGGAGLEIEGSTTTDVADILDGDQATVSITVAGAELADRVEVVASISLAGLGLTAYVSASDTVTAVLQNNSGGAINLASATYTAIVTKR